jgi:predicted Zn-dependent protease
VSGGSVRLAGDVVALAKKRYPDGDVGVSVWDGWTANTRFARNEPTTNGDVEESRLDVELAFGKRHASASTNQTDEASIAKAIDRATTMARLSPEDAEWMPPLGKQQFARVDAAFDPEVPGFDATKRAAAMGAAISEAKARGVLGAGYLECDAHEWTIANSHGLFGFHRRTRAEMTMTARTPDGTGSGWAARASQRAAELDAGAVSRVASEKGVQSAKPRPLDPGKYTVILEPAAVADLLQFFVSALDARRADEGRSFFSKTGGSTKLGEKLFPDMITLESDPSNPETPAAPFDGSGVPLGRVAWVDRGVVSALRYSRYWAAKQGKQPTGDHGSFLLRGGTVPRAEDLLSGVKRGLVVTRFWYTRWLEPKAMSITGLTRDGVFLVEDGRITGPVNNFRFNESPANVLASCDAMTAETTRVANDGDLWRVPTLRTTSFNMASVSAAV